MNNTFMSTFMKCNADGSAMPRTESELKDSLLCTRVTPRIKDAVTQQASQEGITPSEWLRNIIVKELRERGALTTTFRLPKIREKRP